MTGGLIFGLDINLDFRLKSLITVGVPSGRLPTIFDCTRRELVLH